MQPVNVNKTVAGQRVVFAIDQPEYIPLPAVVSEDNPNVIVTEWSFDDDEKAIVAAGGHLFLQQLTFGQPLQPINLQVSCEGEPLTVING